jgi:ABC-type antimicrobial peptide transport system permease subunit
MDRKEFNFIRDRLCEKIVTIEDYVWVPFCQEENDKDFVVITRKNDVKKIVDKHMQRIVKSLFSKRLSTQKKYKRIDKILLQMFNIKDRVVFNLYLKTFSEVQTGGPVIERLASIYRLPKENREFYFNLADVSNIENGVYILTNKKIPIGEFKRYRYLNGKKIRKDMKMTRTKYKRMIGGNTVHLIDERTVFYKDLEENGFLEEE